VLGRGRRRVLYVATPNYLELMTQGNTDTPEAHIAGMWAFVRAWTPVRIDNTCTVCPQPLPTGQTMEYVPRRGCE
jgi:hypothetical protein